MRIPIEDVEYADLLVHLPSVCQFIDPVIRSVGAISVHDVQASSTPCRHRALRINYRLIHLPSVCQFIEHAIRSGGTILVHDVQASSTPYRHRALRINYTMTGCLSHAARRLVLLTVSVAFFLSTPIQRLDVPKLCDLTRSARASSREYKKTYDSPFLFSATSD
jgi:hypothetical protein